MIADAMGLRDWEFILSETPSDEDTWAQVCPTEGQKHAAIQVCKEFRGIAPEKQRMVVVHELLHCHHAHTQDIVRIHVGRFLGQHAYDAFMDSWRLAHEYAIDGVACAWAERLPLIQWPKRKDHA